MDPRNSWSSRNKSGLLRTLLPAAGCVFLLACTGRDAASPAIPPGALAEITCGELSLLEGGRIRLAEMLDRATLHVRPVDLSAEQGRWMLEDGWRDEPSPSPFVRTRDGRATVRIPELPCVPAYDENPPVFLRVAISRDEGVEIPNPAKVRLVSRDEEIGATELLMSLSAFGHGRHPDS